MSDIPDILLAELNWTARVIADQLFEKRSSLCQWVPSHVIADLWDGEDRLIEQVIAFVSDLEVARAAYAAAVKAKPGKRITLRQRARVLERSLPTT